MPIKNWTPAVIEKRAMEVSEQRMALATTFLQGEVRRAINISNSKGAAPSAPGEPPRKGSGDLQRSIFGEVTRTAKSIVGSVGSRMVYARRLELGFVGKDSEGRTIDQKPRPYLRSTFFANRDRIKRILGGGK
jgi:hypothetical protein